MTFKKLALATAIAMVPATAMADMVELEDNTLSGVNGQDGLELAITTTAPMTSSIYIHDTDGLIGVPSGVPGGTTAHSFDGVVVIQGYSLSGNMNIEIDAGDNVLVGPSNATLNLRVSVPSAMTIVTGSIRVGNSQRDDGTPGWLANSLSGVILSAMTIVLPSLAMNIQLGNEPQGNAIALDTTITNGITMTNFALNDAGGAVTGGALGAASILLMGTGNTPYQVQGGINLNTSGLVMDIQRLGAAGGADMYMTDAYLGSTGTGGIIGDMAIIGLNMTGTRITISGK